MFNRYFEMLGVHLFSVFLVWCAYGVLLQREKSISVPYISSPNFSTRYACREEDNNGTWGNDKTKYEKLLCLFLAKSLTILNCFSLQKFCLLACSAHLFCLCHGLRKKVRFASFGLYEYFITHVFSRLSMNFWRC